MNETIRVRGAFTLIELMIVIILIGTAYSLIFSSFSLNTQKKYKIGIENIKEFLLSNFPYENKLSLVCIESDANDCYVFIDGNLNKDLKIENLFNTIPEVYNYDKSLTKVEFNEIKIDDIDYEPFFELNFNSDRKHKSMIIDTLDSKVYLISSISKDIKKFEYTNDVLDMFLGNEIEVKDAL